MPLFSKTDLNLNDSKKKALERIMKAQKVMPIGTSIMNDNI